MSLNPYREVIIASLVFWTSGIFIKYLHLPPTTIAFFRLAIPTLIIGIWMWYTQKGFRHRGDRKDLLLLSSLNVVRMYLYFLWFTMTSAGNAIVALYTSPIFGMIFAVRLLREKMNRVRYISIILAVIWLITIGYGKWFWLTDGDSIGIGAIVLSAFIQWYVTVLLKTSLRTYDKISIIFYQCVVGAVVFLPFVFVNTPLPTWWQIGLASIYAFLIGVVGFALYFSALKRIDLTVVSILTYIEMVSGIGLAWLILWESITIPLILGAGFIILSGIILIGEKKLLSDKVFIP